MFTADNSWTDGEITPTSIWPRPTFGILEPVPLERTAPLKPGVAQTENGTIPRRPCSVRNRRQDYCVECTECSIGQEARSLLPSSRTTRRAVQSARRLPMTE